MAGKGKKHNQETIKEAAKLLAGLPEKPKVKEYTNAETVRLLKSEIRAAQAKGYTLKEIIDHLKSTNIEVGISTVKTEMRTTRRTRVKSGAAPASAGQPGGNSEGN